MDPKHQLQPVAQATQELIAVAELAKEAIAQYGRRTDVESERVRNEEKKQRQDSAQRARDHLYFFIICISLILISAGLIFLLKQVSTGVSLLSYLLVFGAGAFGGIGIQHWLGERR